MDTLTPINIIKGANLEKFAIKVYLRTRPLLEQEVKEGASNILKIIPHEHKVLVEDGCKGCFYFDGVCDENESQKEVFEKVVSSLLPHIQNGQNVNVIAYGQTGSGKTYTIGTNPQYSQINGGMLQRVMHRLLEKDKMNRRSKENIKFSLKMTFLEIYNENIYDLFSSREIVETKGDGFGGIVPINCTEELVESTEEGLSLLTKGNNLRSVASTAMNAHSSRSHAVISVTLYQEMRGGTIIPRGCLRMVDLAGAEGVGRSNTEGKNFTEGVSINKDLLTVGRVLAALSDNSISSHVPYRDSMVTRLLRDALSGNNSNTVMVVCVNPASTNLSVTLNTLRYAEQARNIKIKPQRFSTAKKTNSKRYLDDISANPVAWKKFASEWKKANPNSTISTPGHKPPVRKLQTMNSTFMTPLNRTSNFARPFPRSSSRTDLRSITELSIKQPNFEDEISPTNSIICAPNADSTLIQISPIVEKMRSRFEQSILQCEERMKYEMREMEHKLAKNVAKMLLKGNNLRRSYRLQLKNVEHSVMESPKSTNKIYESSLRTPTNKISSFNSTSGGESPFCFIDSVAQALLKKENFQSTIKTAISVGHCENKNSASNKSCLGLGLQSRTPLGEISNLNLTSHQHPAGALKEESFQTCLPITSTVGCNGKVVRRSNRVNLRKIGQTACLISPLVRSDRTPDISINSSLRSSGKSIKNDTVIFCNDEETQSASPELPFKSPSNTKMTTLYKNSSIQFCRASDVAFSTITRRRSSRRSAVNALHAIKKNCQVINSKSPKNPFVKKVSDKHRKKRTSKGVSDKSVDQSMISKFDLTMVSPSIHREHSDQILNLLNTASLRELQKLPTVGPKTAMVIGNSRKMFGKLNSMEDLQRIPGLTKSFVERFMKANLISI